MLNARTLIQQLPRASRLKHFHGMKVSLAVENAGAASKFTFAAKGLIQKEAYVSVFCS